jgi:photosynthetic reaction center H subunit
MKGVGAFTGYVDAAQVTLYVFWAFFAGLIYYLRREDKREGYPLDDDRTLHTADRTVLGNIPGIPSPKTYLLSTGGVIQAPKKEPPPTTGNSLPVAPWPGAPLQPLGDPMLAAVGPGSFVHRHEVAAETPEHDAKIVPMRETPERFVDPKSPDPRGMVVRGADGRNAGVVEDLWIDKSEDMVRYLEVRLTLPGATTRNVLVPMVMVRLRPRWRQVRVKAILAQHFANIPLTRLPDRVTFREEDRIVGYFGGGYLYASSSRLGPVL